MVSLTYILWILHQSDSVLKDISFLGQLVMSYLLGHSVLLAQLAQPDPYDLRVLMSWCPGFMDIRSLSPKISQRGN